MMCLTGQRNCLPGSMTGVTIYRRRDNAPKRPDVGLNAKALQRQRFHGHVLHGKPPGLVEAPVILPLGELARQTKIANLHLRVINVSQGEGVSIKEAQVILPFSVPFMLSHTP